MTEGRVTVNGAAGRRAFSWRGGARLRAYVLAEVLPLLLGILLVIIVLFLLAALYAVIAPLLAKGASPLLVARLLAFELPDALSRGLPIALLFAVTLGLSRLSDDSELKAMLASGVPSTSVFTPVLLLSGAVALLAFVSAETVLPRAKAASLATQREIVLDNPRVLGLGAGAVFRDALGRAITVGELGDDGALRDIRVLQPGANGPRELIEAERGQLQRERAVLLLEGGVRVTFRDGRPNTVARFESAALPLQDLQTDLSGEQGLRPVYRPLPELFAAVREGAGPAERAALQRKFADPLSALAFGFFGVSLSLFSFRRRGSLGLAGAVMLTFAYYATWSVFRILGEGGALPAVLAAWAPGGLFVLAGAVLLLLSRR